MAKPITPILSLHVWGNRAQKREVTCGEGVDPGDHRSWALGCRRWSREQLLSMHGVASLRDKETEAQIGKERRLQRFPGKPAVRVPCFCFGGAGSIPCRGTELSPVPIGKQTK